MQTRITIFKLKATYILVNQLTAVLDAFEVLCVKDAYIKLLESLLLTSVGGYFVLRSADKYVKK